MFWSPVLIPYIRDQYRGMFCAPVLILYYQGSGLDCWQLSGRYKWNSALAVQYHFWEIFHWKRLLHLPAIVVLTVDWPGIFLTAGKYCRKNNCNLDITTEPVRVGADATVFFRFVVQICAQMSDNFASGPAVTASTFMRRFSLALRKCSSVNGLDSYSCRGGNKIADFLFGNSLVLVK